MNLCTYFIYIFECLTKFRCNTARSTMFRSRRKCVINYLVIINCCERRRRGRVKISEQITAGIDKRERRNERCRWPVFAWRELPASSSFSRRAQSDFPATELIDGSAGSGLMREEWRARKKEIKSAKGKRPRWNHALIKVDQTRRRKTDGSLFVEKKKR